MTTTIDTHPVLARLAEMRSLVSELGDFQPALWDEKTQAQALRELHQLESMLTAQRLRLMAGADRVVAADGSKDIAAWLTRHTRAQRAGVSRDHRLARSLDGTWTRVGAAVAAGSVNLDQARVMVAVLDELPADEVTPEQMAHAERHLVGLCGEFVPEQLKLLGHHLLDVIAPERAEEIEGKRLADQERRARETARLSFTDNHDGTTAFRGKLPTATAGRWQEFLHAYTNARHRGVDRDRDQAEGISGVGADGERIGYTVRLGHAHCQLLERIDPATLPDHGGDTTRIVITLDYDTLTSDLGHATTATGDRISAGEARRLACTAGILPAVLDSTSRVLDLGRTRRLFTPAQNTAIRITHRHCATVGCTIPARWTETHHEQPWSRGGRTDLSNAVPLCAHHHHRAHDPAYTVTTTPTGTWQFHRRQ